MKLSICCGAKEHQYIKSFCSACKEATAFEQESDTQETVEAKVFASLKKQYPDVSDEWLETHVEVVVS